MPIVMVGVAGWIVILFLAHVACWVFGLQFALAARSRWLMLAVASETTAVAYWVICSGGPTYGYVWSWWGFGVAVAAPWLLAANHAYAKAARKRRRQRHTTRIETRGLFIDTSSRKS